jgi:DNA processing protein
MVKGIGAVRLRTLLDTFGDAQQAWTASPQALRQAGLSDKLVENLARLRADVSLEQVWEDVQAKEINILTWEDEGYPTRLRDVDNAPPVLYLRGTITLDDDWAVAIVGTRRATSYGRQVAERIARELARNGVTVVSGMARGIDGVAHRAALDTGGRTLAVLGSGVDRIYPPEHRRLAKDIVSQGALVSDYPPGTPPEGRNFPPRNRIIAGLSLATVVVEAGKRSGALITSDFALEQGREVFAVPGSVMAPQSRGPNRLIQQGAHPLLDPKEILETLELSLLTEQRQARTVLPSNPSEAQIFDVLGYESLHVDEIQVQTGMPIEEVTATLAMMELKGMVRKVGAMRYMAIGEMGADYEANQ